MNSETQVLRLISLQRNGIFNVGEYMASVRRDYESIRGHLPSSCLDVLDVGSGMAGIDILLHERFACNVHLLDKDGIAENLYYDYRKEAAHYNSLSIARDFLIDNKVRPESIFTYDVNKGEMPSRPSAGFGIIISLISCGFHYPVETYLGLIQELMSGIVILDVRKGTGQDDLLRQNFSSVETIREYYKYWRVLCR